MASTLPLIRLRAATAISALALGACGSSANGPKTSTQVAGPAVPTTQAHPQVVAPVAGQDTTVPLATPVPDPVAGAKLTPSTHPSPGAPSDAAIRQAYAHFHAAELRYRLYALNFSGVLLNPSQLPSGQWFVSIASVYTDYGKPIACGGVLHVPQLGVAHKTLPCGTMVTFVYGNRAIRVPVIDRGPYIAGREWDLTGATAEALHFPGLGQIEWHLG